MKRSIGMVLCMCLGQLGLAQSSPPLSKGNFFLSAGGSWKAEEYRVKSKLRWSLDPQVGYFVIDKVSIGLIGNIGFSEFDYSETNEITGITKTNLKEGGWWGLGPAVRGHLGSEKFALFAQLSALFGSLEQNSENNFTENNDTYLREKGSYQMVSFSPGFAWNFIPKLGVEALAHFYWASAYVRSGNVSQDGQVDELNAQQYSATGGGWSVNLVYFFGLGGSRADRTNP
ncbi:MAG: hypothetical protein KDB88_06190 [Flavobacteriales bacterium]|nr:hypothetical protein [Flavobacteriales bacterium]